MNLSQHTDEQLIKRLDLYGLEILETSDCDVLFDHLCERYDAVKEELEARGLWT